MFYCILSSFLMEYLLAKQCESDVYSLLLYSKRYSSIFCRCNVYKNCCSLLKATFIAGADVAELIRRKAVCNCVINKTAFLHGFLEHFQEYILHVYSFATNVKCLITCQNTIQIIASIV